MGDARSRSVSPKPALAEPGFRQGDNVQAPQAGALKENELNFLNLPAKLIDPFQNCPVGPPMAFDDQVGDKLQVYSHSQKKWVDCEVTSVDDKGVTVAYRKCYTVANKPYYDIIRKTIPRSRRAIRAYNEDLRVRPKSKKPRRRLADRLLLE